MINYEITSKDFRRIALENEYFFWHFTAKKDVSLELHPYGLPMKKPELPHRIREIVDTLKIPYYESKIEEEFDFVIQLKSEFIKKVWRPIEGFSPVIISFNRFKILHSTFDGICYCKEGFLDIIWKTNRKFLEDLDLSDD